MRNRFDIPSWSYDTVKLAWVDVFSSGGWAMRQRVNAVCFIILSIASVSDAEEAPVTSLAGDWTVTASTRDGVPDESRTFLYKFIDQVDTQFTLYENGYGKLQTGKDNDIWWAYDKVKRTFTIKVPHGDYSAFPWAAIVENGKAVRDKDSIVLSCIREYRGGMKYQCVLTFTPTRLVDPSEKGSTITLENKAFDREFFTEDYETKPGVPKTITLKRDFESSVTATGTVGGEVNGQVKAGNELVGVISVGLKTKIEASLGTTIGTRDTFEESYNLDGKNHIKMTVKWVKRYRKGTINLADGTKKSFEVFVGYRTIPEYDK